MMLHGMPTAISDRYICTGTFKFVGKTIGDASVQRIPDYLYIDRLVYLEYIAGCTAGK